MRRLAVGSLVISCIIVVACQQPPGTGPTPAAPAGYGQQPPAYGQAQACGQPQSPGYGQQPAPYGQPGQFPQGQSPPYGQPAPYAQPPAYGQQPPPAYGQPSLPGQPLPGQPLPGQPLPGQPLPGQPLPGQAPLPGQFPGPLPGQGPGQAPTAGAMAVPGAAAFPCSNDAACGLAHCNVQYGKCAFPCVDANVDCVQGNGCIAGFCVPKLPGT